jgi:hypothetical protein
MGDNTIIDNRFTPIKVYHLEMVFDRFPDDIFKTSPVYVVSNNLYDIIIDLKLTGINNPRLISYNFNDQYNMLQPDGKKPTQNYYMVDISENESEDFSLVRVNNLIRLSVSEKGLEVLRTVKIDFADIIEI